MDNNTRSERSRNAAIEAALAIIERDGPSRLTLEAIAREGGMSKGGLMHHFPTKEAVLRELLEREMQRSETFSRNFMAASGSEQSHSTLLADIATTREAMVKPRSFTSAILGAFAQDPDLMAVPLELSARKLESIKAEAGDPDLATLRWAAARGLLLTSLLGICPLSQEDRSRLFDRLLDDRQWTAFDKSGEP